MESNVVVSSILGQGKVNQLGGHYINGRPLSSQKREAIVEMYRKGEKPCNISRLLQISHGAVSKILNRYQETGSIQPGQIGGTARTRKTVVHFEKDIRTMLDSNAQIQPKEIRSNLIKMGRCTKDDAPTESSIGRRLTMYKRAVPDRTSRLKTSTNGKITRNSTIKMEQPSPQLIYSIDSILGTSSTSHANINVATALTDNTSTSNVSDDTWTSDEESNGDNRCENRRNRTAFTAEQIKTLEKRFTDNMYPTEDDKKAIISDTGLDLNRINTWFSNRRARVRKSCGFGVPPDASTIATPSVMPLPTWMPQAIPGFPLMPGSPPLPFAMPNIPLINQLLMMSKSFDPNNTTQYSRPGLDFSL